MASLGLNAGGRSQHNPTAAEPDMTPFAPCSGHEAAESITGCLNVFATSLPTTNASPPSRDGRRFVPSILPGQDKVAKALLAE